MFSTPSLFHKALVLVIVPLILEAIIVCSLLYLLNESERDIAEQELLKKIVIKANLAMNCFNKAARWKIYSLEQYGSSGVFDRYVTQSLTPLPKLFSDLRELAATGHPRWLKHANATEAAGHDVTRLMALTRRSGSEQGLSMKTLRLLDELRLALNRLDFAIGSMLNDSLEIEKKAAMSLGKQRLLQKLLLASFMALGAVLAVGMTYYFHKGTMNRLFILVANAQLFKDERPLHPPLEGHDEIGVLDKAFHEMANTVTESASRERAIIRNAKEVICSLDSELNFVKINPACQTVWNYSVEELTGKSLFSLVPRYQQIDTEAAIANLKKNPEGGTFESKVRKPSGELIDILWSVNWSESDKSLFCVCHDISEQKKIEQLKRDFVAMVSHDLRTPLASMKMILEMLDGGMLGELPEKAQKAVTRETKNCDYLIALINQLLEIEKLESGNIQLDKEEISIGDIFAQTKQALTVLAERSGLSLVIGDTCQVLVDADKQRITQVMMNLVSNAIKFSPKNASITMQADLEQDCVKVSVIDQGRGIPKEAIDKVFDRFQQVERDDEKVKGGSGLGLAICKAIVDAHNGQIGVESEEGKGSCFWFRLPMDTQES